MGQRVAPVYFTDGGIALSIGVNSLTAPAGQSVNATNLTAAANWPSIIGGALRSTNAGIVEEVVIVALPVLLGRRAGWRPAVIVALSVLLRFPYHLYHGAWPAVLLWTIAWAAPHALAYLYLRRLWPLIITHICQDLLAFYAPQHAVANATWAVLGALLAAAAVRTYIGYRQRRRTITDTTGTPITYHRLDSGSINITTKAKRLPDLWAALTVISQDQPHRPGRNICNPPKRSPQVRQLTAHGYPRPRWTKYRIATPLSPSKPSTLIGKATVVNYN